MAEPIKPTDLIQLALDLILSVVVYTVQTVAESNLYHRNYESGLNSTKKKKKILVNSTGEMQTNCLN